MKSRRIVFRLEAETDLFDIYRYIAQASGSINLAFEFTERLRTTCYSLEHFPERGTMRNEIKKGLRILTHEHKTVIAYFVTHDSVTISNIFHAGRDWEAFIADQNDEPRRE